MQIAQLEDFLQLSPLKTVLMNASEGALLDSKATVWATFEFRDERITFFSIQGQTFTEEECLENLIQLAIDFDKQSKRFLPELRRQFAQQKLTIEHELRTNTTFRQQVQAFVQMLGELGRTSHELPTLLATLHYWTVLFANSPIKKSFFRRYELLNHFYRLTQQTQAVFEGLQYEQLRDVVLDFCQQNNIRDTHLLLYRAFVSLVQEQPIAASKRLFVPFWNQICAETRPTSVLIYDADFLKIIENQEFKKNVLFAVATTTEQLMCMHSTAQQTEQATLLADATSLQTGIFGISKMALLSQKIRKKAFDLIFLDVLLTSFTRKGKIPLLFQSLNKEDKQILFTIQAAFNQLSEKGKLCVFLPSTAWITEKKYATLRRLLEEWANQIQILENKIEKNTLLILSKQAAPKGVLYLEINKKLTSSPFSSSLEDWQPKTKLSPFFKLLPANTTPESKGLFDKSYILPPFKQVKNYVDINQKNLIVKVSAIFQKYHQKQISNPRLLKFDAANEPSLGKLFFTEKASPTKEENQSEIAVQIEPSHIIESRISLIEDGFWYYEPSFFDEFYPLDKLFPKRKKGENLVLLWSLGEIWLFDAPIFPFFVHQLLPEAHVFPLFVFEKGKKYYNFSPSVLDMFRKVYLQNYEKRIRVIEEQLKNLFNTVDFEFLQLSADFAFGLRAWAAWLETPMASVLYTQFDTQKDEVKIAFEQGKHLFGEAKRLFELLGTKGARSQESYQSLKRYFQNTFFEELPIYWRQIEQEKLENFIVPTVESMCEDAIFDYLIAAWSDENFRYKYRKELAANLPRIPFYKDFHGYAKKGKKLRKLFLDSSKADLQVVEIASNTKKLTKKYWQADKDNAAKVWFDANTWIENIPDKFTQVQVCGMTLLEHILTKLRKQKKSLKEGVAILESLM